MQYGRSKVCLLMETIWHPGSQTACQSEEGMHSFFEFYSFFVITTFSLDWYAQIGGLQLEGCSFDSARLVENRHDSPSVVAMPPCMVSWVTKETPPLYPPGECLSLPVYQSSSRERLVTCVDVPCGSGGRGTWLQNNPALFLNN